jgi:hypothetical protein
MNTTKYELELIKLQQREFQSLVAESSGEELGQCAKLLAMYIAVYKKQFGDIPVEDLLKISDSVSMDQDLSGIIQDGIEEAASMLQMVRDEKRQKTNSFYYNPTFSSIN